MATSAMKISGDVILELDERNPGEFFVKLRWLAVSNDWTAEKTTSKCLLFIGLKQTWLATRLEKEVLKQTGKEIPTVERLQEMLEAIVAPKIVRHTYMDEFEKIVLNNRSGAIGEQFSTGLTGGRDEFRRPDGQKTVDQGLPGCVAATAQGSGIQGCRCPL